MNRFRVSSTGGSERSAVAGGTPSGSSAASISTSTNASGGSSNKGIPVPQEFGSAPAANSSGSNGTFQAPLPPTLSPSPPSTPSTLLPSPASSAEPSPWLSLSASASSPAPAADGNGRKRRMLLDADVRCAEKGPSFFDGGSNSDSIAAAADAAIPRGSRRPPATREVSLDSGNAPRVRQPNGGDRSHDGDGRSGESFMASRSPPPPPPPSPSPLSDLRPGSPSSCSPPSPFSLSGGKGKQRGQQSPPPAVLRGGNDGDTRGGAPGGSAGGGGWPAPRGGGESPSAERPSTPASPMRRGQRRQPARLRGAARSPSLSSSSSPPVDTMMEDHDPFDEISRAEELALAAAAASIQTAKNRQLATREGIAITHSRLLQRDNGFVLRADADRLLEATRSLLQDLGLEVVVDDNDGVAAAAVAAEPMDQEEEYDDSAVPPPSPPTLQRQESRDDSLGDEASPPVFRQDAQVPPQGQAVSKTVSPRSVADFFPGGGDGDVAGARAPQPVEGEEGSYTPPPAVGVEGRSAAATGGEDVGRTAMDVQG